MSGSERHQIPSLPGYDWVRQLGSGTTGTVYLARQISTGRDVAVKVFSPELLGRPGFRERFRDEARIMTRFDDEHLVNIFDYLEPASGGAYLVMQYVPGVSLRQFMTPSDHLDAEQSLGVLAGALSGLEAAHRLGVVHGDLKPENVLVSAEGASMLVDFGQASPTGSRTSGGTPAYASPEALRDETVDARSDIYAAGLILYELLAGRPPFEGTAAEVVAAHLFVAPARVRGVAAPVADLVARSLAKTPSARPDTAADFLAELEAAASAGYGPDWRRRASIAGAAGVLVGGLSALGAGAAAGSSASSSAPALSVATRIRPAHLVRRLVSRIHAYVSAHPASAVAAAAVVAGTATAVSLIGGTAAVAGPFSAVSGSGNPTRVVCQDDSHCWADLGAAILLIGPSGRRSVSQLPTAAGTVADVSCPSDSFCIAAGSDQAGNASVVSSSDGGVTWQTGHLPAGAGAVTSLNCAPATTTCWAAAKSGLYKTIDGTTWTAVSTPSGSGPVSLISCPSATTCVGVAGGSADTTHDGGATWKSVPLPGVLYTVASVDCVNTSICWIVGEYTNSLQSQIGTINRTTDGGATWSHVPFPASPQPYAFDSVSCWSVTSCLIDGTVEWGGLESSSGSPYFLATTDGGSSWTVHLAPETMPFVPSIDCLSAKYCLLSGQSGVGVTSDDGASWDVGFYGPKLTISALSCVNATECYAGGSFPDLTRNHLGAFITPTANPMAVLLSLQVGGGYSAIDSSDQSLSGLDGLACTPSQCTAIGNTNSGNQPATVALDPRGRAAPTVLDLPGGMQSVAGVACAASTECMVSGQSGGQPVLLRQSGSEWIPLPLPYATQSVGAVACPGRDSCLVVATNGSGPALYEGALRAVGVHGVTATWQEVALPASVHSLAAIACPSTNACWLSGVAVSGNSTTPEVWRNLHLRIDPGELSATSTTAPSASTTTTSVARLLSIGGWTAERLPTGVTGVTAIACPSTASCFAVATLTNGSQALLGAGHVGTLMKGEIASPPTT